MVAVEALAKQEATDEVRLTVWAFNAPAVGLYLKSGFSTTVLDMSKAVTDGE